MRHNIKQPYTQLLHYARKVARRTDEAEDLLQTVLLAAVEAGRADMSCIENGRWLMGALRKRAAFDARSAVRRQRREASATLLQDLQTESDGTTADFVRTLPRSLRTTALLTLSGHTKAELAWLLRVPDTALRQRIAQIKRRWRHFDGSYVSGISSLKGELAFGQIREALLQLSRRDKVMLASHDPDGHLFMVSSQNKLLRQHKGESIIKEEFNNVK